jgi:hypothetical protein
MMLSFVGVLVVIVLQNRVSCLSCCIKSNPRSFPLFGKSGVVKLSGHDTIQALSIFSHI